MKSMIKGMLRGMARSPGWWRLLDGSLLRVTRGLEWQREIYDDERRKADLAEKTKRWFPDLIVRHGPFSGMRYPWAMACGSPLFSKILGSYERELSGVVESLCAVGYPAVINVGSAEGYYAVGFARRMPSTRVLAFDIEPEARKLVRELADANGVGERVQVDGFCSPSVLLERCRGGSGLILSDCEGYEKTLFTRDVASAISSWDVLIEVHDLIDIEVSTRLVDAFAGSHEIIRIQSVDDIQKALTYRYQELEGQPVAERRHLLGEGRRAIMEWFLAVGKQSPGGPALIAAARAAAERDKTWTP